MPAAHGRQDGPDVMGEAARTAPLPGATPRRHSPAPLAPRNGHSPATCYDPMAMELYGVRIPTIISENVSIRCAGCGGIIRGTPWRISILDIVAPETPPSWTESTGLNPGPFQFHSDPDHVLAWMAQRGMLFCRRSQVREIMRPVWLPGDPARLGLCDGIHRDDHEFVELSAEAHRVEARPSAEEAAKAEARALAPQPTEPAANEEPGR